MGEAFGDAELLTPPTPPGPLPAALAAQAIPAGPPPIEGAIPQDGPITPSDSTVRYLLPPGALPASAFSATCSRCGYCVSNCPVQAIKMTPEVCQGQPHIIARQAPCVLCEDLTCTKVCPTGALTFLNDRMHVRLGVVRVDQARCLRIARQEDCQFCVTQCPIGGEAIGIDPGNQIEVRASCTGCGVCEHACPTDPPSIWVEPNP